MNGNIINIAEFCGQQPVRTCKYIEPSLNSKISLESLPRTVDINKPLFLKQLLVILPDKDWNSVYILVPNTYQTFTFNFFVKSLLLDLITVFCTLFFSLLHFLLAAKHLQSSFRHLDSKYN